MRQNLPTQYLEIDIFHALEYRWPQWTAPYIAWPRQYALWWIEEGALQVSIGEQRWTLEAGDVFLAPMRQPRYLGAPLLEGVHWWSLNFVPSWFSRIDPLQALQQPLLLKNPPGLGELRQYMALLAKRWMAPWNEGPVSPLTMERYRSLLPLHRAGFTPQEQIICQGLAQAILGWCLEVLEENGIPLRLHQSIPPWLPVALAAIEENPRLTIEELAQAVSFSPAQLRRLFHQWLGVSPQDYLVTRRMDIAHQLLETTTMPVSAIAASLGYASAPSFARVFRNVYGIAPAQVRQTLRARREV